MNKYVDPEELKNEIAKAPVWTSLTIIEIINKMTKPITQTETQNSNLTFEKTDRMCRKRKEDKDEREQKISDR